MKIICTCIIFFLLAFIQGRVITRGQWLIEKPIKVPNHWSGHAVVGIFSVVTAVYFLGFLPRQAYITLFAVFLSALPGIYFASVENWSRCNMMAKEILATLKGIHRDMNGISNKIEHL